MTPLEILFLIAIAIVVIIATCWAFGMFKTEQKLSETPETSEIEVQPDNEPIIIEIKEEPQAAVKHYAPTIPTKKSSGRTYVYTILNKWYYSAKDGDYYQTIQSSQGSIFYITRDGKRRYLSAKEKESLKEFM